MFYKVVIFSLLIFLNGCDDNAVDTQEKRVEKEIVTLATQDRIVELDITEPENKEYHNNILSAKEIGVDAISVSLDWTVIELGLDAQGTPVYASGENDFLEILNNYYSAQNLKVSLTLRPVLTLIRNTPDDLDALALDDPRVVARFKALIDHVISKVDKVTLTSLIIGSEVDLYLQDETLRASYLEFYKEVSVYAREQYAKNYPQKSPLLIAVESTFEGLTSASTSEYFKRLNVYSDVIGISYYPIEDMKVKDPKIVHEDFASLIALYPTKSLYFYQLGYPSGYYSAEDYTQSEYSSASLDSSDIKQAQFIDEVFKAWERYPSNIGLIDFTWMHDLSYEDVIASTSNAAFGGTSDPSSGFAEFLQTLGLRTYGGDGKDKLAFERLRENLKSFSKSD